MSDVSCFQAKAELFEVAKHLFDPASSDIERERPGIGREVGQEIPWFRVLFVLTPSASELDRLVCQFRWRTSEMKRRFPLFRGRKCTCRASSWDHIRLPFLLTR